MKVLTKFLILILIPLTNHFAMVKPIDLNFSPVDQISKSKFFHQQNIDKAKLLLKSHKMDQSFSLALTEVLNRNVRSNTRFDLIQAKYKDSKVLKQKSLHNYSKLLDQQSQLFYKLTKFAHYNQLDLFNTSARKMLILLEDLKKSESSLQLN
ncbi:MAG: hypothetical protein KC646_06590 [Candidatus Cloacimonetes bacterium]|nr:hypothetical protein [Candidatus Cloacimonadota bacterium]